MFWDTIRDMSQADEFYIVLFDVLEHMVFCFFHFYYILLTTMFSLELHLFIYCFGKDVKELFFR
jgi:hypothetical protein